MNHTRLTRGERKGRSPMEVLQERVDAGWRPLTVNPEAVDAAFCERTTLTVRAGAVSYKGVRYTHARLRSVSSRTVEAALPWRRGCDPLFNDGQGWAYREPDTPFRSDSLDGARVSTARQREQDRAVASLGREGRLVDTVALRLAREARRSGLRLPGGGGMLDTGAELIDLAAGKTDAAHELLADLSEAERKRRVRERTTERLLRSQSNVA